MTLLEQNYDVRSYAFSRVNGTTASGNLGTPGSRSISFSYLPFGIAVNNKVYISGGSGTAEAVLVTAVSGTQGSVGSITVTTIHIHTGSWIVSSATSGIQEAAQIAQTSGSGAGTLYLPAAQLPIHALITLPSVIGLRGGGFRTSGGTAGTILLCDAGINGMAIADNLGTATGQGLGLHYGFKLLSASGGAIGLWLGGGGPAGFDASWSASYLRLQNIQIEGFAIAVTHNRGNFVSYIDSVFSGTTRALVFPSTGGGEHQPVVSRGCVWSVPSGMALQMDDSGFSTNVFQMFGDQISGSIGGNDVFIELNGVHYEPNSINSGLVDVTGAGATIKINGGIASVHGTALTSMFSCAGTGNYALTIRDLQVQADVAMVVTNMVNFATTSGGELIVEKNRIAAAGTFTKQFNISKATLDAAVAVYVNQPNTQASTGITAAASIDFNGANGNYPTMQLISIVGGTVGGSGITVITGVTPYANGVLITTSAQTFTIGATIGETVTTVAGRPYPWRSDGAAVWL